MKCDHSKIVMCEICGKKFVLCEETVHVDMSSDKLNELENSLKECEQHLIHSQKINEKLKYENISLKNYLNEVEENNNRIIQENEELKTTIRGMCKALGGGR